MVTDFNQLDLSKKYTYADYLTWWFEERVELIRGKILKMSPAPSDNHQKIHARFVAEIAPFLKRKPCQIRYAPFDVKLKRSYDDKEVFTIVQPDICIVCKPEILEPRGCNGAPDMIIEILSESNRKHDLVTKFQLYEESGVNEYWIVYPMDSIDEVYLLEAGKYKLDKKYIEDELVPVRTIDGLNIDLKDIFY